MPVDTDLTVTPVKYDSGPSALQTLGTLANLRGQATENILRQAQIQQAGVQTQDLAEQAAQRQRENQSYNTLTALGKDPAHAAEFGAGNFRAAQEAGVDSKVIAGAAANHASIVKSAMENDTATNNLIASRSKEASARVGGILYPDPQNPLQEADETKFRQQWPALVSGMENDKIIQPGTLPHDITGIDQAKDLLSKAAFIGAIHATAAKNQETQATINEKAKQAEAEAALQQTRTAELPGVQATAADKQRALNASHLLDSGSPEEYATRRAALGDAAADFPETFNPDAVLAAGQTIEQRAMSQQARNAAAALALSTKRTADIAGQRTVIEGEKADAARELAGLPLLHSGKQPPTPKPPAKNQIMYLNPDGTTSPFNTPQQVAVHQADVDKFLRDNPSALRTPAYLALHPEAKQ